MFDFFTKEIGFDPGSENLRIVHDGQIVFDEPTLIDINTSEGKVAGIGTSVNKGQDHKLIKPINMVIRDFQAFEFTLREAIKKSLNLRSFLSPSFRMFISIPPMSSEVDKRGYRDSAEHAGANEVYMVSQSVCASISMGLVTDRREFVLIDIGASKLEISVFADSFPIAHGVISFGTWKLKQALKNKIFREHKVVLEENQLNELLLNFKLVNYNGDLKEKLNEDMVLEILAPFCTVIQDQVQQTLEEVASHPKIHRAIGNGIYFTGGGSKLPWLVRKIAMEGKVNFKVSNNPLHDNIKGLKTILSARDQYKMYLMH